MSNNQFIKEKALLNILVYFFNVKISNQGKCSLIDKIKNSVNNIYGYNRFVVYAITDEDLQSSTRILSAKALIVLFKNPQDCIEFKSEIDKKLMLNYDQLYNEESSYFNYDYFINNIQKLIPPINDCNNKTLLTTKSDLFLFDSQKIYRKWSILKCPLKLIDYSQRNGHINSAYLIDWIDEKIIDNSIQFNPEVYFYYLQTESIGRTILFTHVTTTTMDMANMVKNIHGIVVTANYQTTGQGRNQNQWLSPFGCAMFTINVRLKIDNKISLSLIQHIASLSIILALPSKKLNIKIKWPNDVLFIKSMSKLAGILIKSYSYDNMINVHIGIGVNVSNHHPSVCLNDLINHYNNEQTNETEKIPLMSKEEVIAKVLNNFERLYKYLLNNNLEEIKRLYCENWIHNDSIIDVHLNKNEKQCSAQIIGIDDNGYLLAKDLSTNSVLFLQPDGNRFDMMSRLTVQSVK